MLVICTSCWLMQEEALELLAKMHSAKEVTPVVKSITSKTNSAPKRKSFILTEEASDQKKASPCKTPKKWSECKQVKPSSEYFGWQLCQWNGKYINCVITVCRVSMAEYNEPGIWHASEIIHKKGMRFVTWDHWGVIGMNAPSFLSTRSTTSPKTFTPSSSWLHQSSMHLWEFTTLCTLIHTKSL